MNHLEKVYPKFFALPVIYPTSGKSMEYQDLIKHADPIVQQVWALAMCKELGHLPQGYKKNGKITDCIDFIYYKDITKNKKINLCSNSSQNKIAKERPS